MNDSPTFAQYVNMLQTDMFMPSEKLPAETRYVAINGLAIRFCFLAEQSASYIMPAFQHLECYPSDNAVLSVIICDRKSSGNLLTLSPWRDEIEACRDRILMVNSESFHMQYNPDSTIYSLINTDTNLAYYYSNDFAEIPYYEKSSPLKFILHWWCEQHDMCLVHAAAVGVDGKGVLLVGRGGSGKSTTAVGAAVHGFQYAGDDYVVLSSNPTTSAVSIYCSAKMNSDVLELLPALHNHIVNPDRADDDKALIFLDEHFKSTWSENIQLKAVVATKVSEGKACMRKSSPVQVFAEIASTTIFQMPGSGTHTLKALKKVFQKLPVYSFELGTDFSANVEILKDFCQRAA